MIGLRTRRSTGRLRRRLPLTFGSLAMAAAGDDMPLLCRLFGIMNVAAGVLILALIVFSAMQTSASDIGPIAVVGGADGPTSVYVASNLLVCVITSGVALLLAISGVLLLTFCKLKDPTGSNA